MKGRKAKKQKIESSAACHNKAPRIPLEFITQATHIWVLSLLNPFLFLPLLQLTSQHTGNSF
jgi:hypothetical protein